MQFILNTDTDTPLSLRAVASILLEAAARLEQAPAAEGLQFAESDPALAEQAAAQLRALDALRADAPPIVGVADAGPTPPVVGVIMPAGQGAAAEHLADLAARDSEGAVWDAAIHSSSKAKVANGTWKKKRGVGGQKPPAEPPVPLSPTNTAPAATATPAPPVPPPPGAAAPAVPPPPTAAPTVPIASTFIKMMDKANAAIAAKQLTPERVVEIVKSCGAPDLVAVKAMPHLIDVICASIDAETFGK